MSESSLRQALERSGAKVTKTRLGLYAVLNRAQQSLSAYELHELAQNESAGLNLATVYRNLELFGNLGLVETHLHANQSCPTYSLRHGAAPHHLVCRKCGKIYAFAHQAEIESLAKQLQKKSGYQIESHIVEFTGICPSCQAKPGKKQV